MEVANDGGAPNWHVSNASIAALINLCVDVCKRNGIAKLNFTGDKSGNLTQHCYFTNTACPGPYLKSKFKYIADEVNKRLSGGAQQAMPSKPATQPPAGGSSASTSKKCAAAKVSLRALQARIRPRVMFICAMYQARLPVTILSAP